MQAEDLIRLHTFLQEKAEELQGLLPAACRFAGCHDRTAGDHCCPNATTLEFVKPAVRMLLTTDLRRSQPVVGYSRNAGTGGSKTEGCNTMQHVCSRMGQQRCPSPETLKPHNIPCLVPEALR